jgi:outer membrane protein assembly factor BamB
MDAKTGKVTFEHQCLEAVLAPPAVSDEMVFVPLANGALQALPIKTKAFGNLPLNATGSATAPPIVAGNLIAWTTDEGVLVVGNKTGTGSLRYRLKAAGEFAASPTANAGSVFAVTLNGYIYAIDDRTGAIKWSFSVGERVTRAPVAIGKYLLIFTDENNMYKFEAETGAVAEGWERPISGITGYAGASDSRFYVEDIVGNLIVLDRESGRRLGSIDARSPMVPVINEKTDRIYVCTKSGLIQCLREIASVRPVFHDDLMEDDSAAKPAETEDASATEEETNPFKGDSKPTESDNPFGGGGKKSDDSNPFGGGNQQPANDNPFGNQKPSSDNPFGGGGSSDDNPFGKSGGDGLNPFNG